MNTESYQNKKVTTTGDSNPKIDVMDIGKSNTYQHPFLIVAVSLLAVWLVLVAVAGRHGGLNLRSSVHETDVALDSTVPSTNSSPTMEIFGLSAHSENTVGCLVNKLNLGGYKCCYGANIVWCGTYVFGSFMRTY